MFDVECLKECFLSYPLWYFLVKKLQQCSWPYLWIVIVLFVYLFQHMFRVPEKRPPKAVSTAFTVMIFLPLVIMLVVVSSFSHNSSFFDIPVVSLEIVNG